jgi:hypothetical protein
MRPYHPLAGVERPTLATLVSIAGPGETRVLAAAGRLAAQRIAEMQGVSGTSPEAPRIDDEIPQPSTPDAVTVTDVARALVALDPAEVAAFVGDKLESEALEAMSRHWKARLEHATQPLCSELAEHWGRRLALTLFQAPFISARERQVELRAGAARARGIRGSGRRTGWARRGRRHHR